MGMIEEREAWWRNTASATLEERAVLMRLARAQEGALLERMTQKGAGTRYCELADLRQ